MKPNEKDYRKARIINAVGDYLSSKSKPNKKPRRAKQKHKNIEEENPFISGVGLPSAAARCCVRPIHGTGTRCSRPLLKSIIQNFEKKRMVEHTVFQRTYLYHLTVPSPLNGK